MKAQAQSPTSLLLEGMILLLSPQQGCTGLGWEVCWVPDTLFAVFGLQGNRRKENRLRDPCGARASQS